jgi:hypothetical protein
MDMPVQQLVTVRSVRTRVTVTIDLPTSHTEALRDSVAGYMYRPTTVIVTYESTPDEPWRLVDRIEIVGRPLNTAYTGEQAEPRSHTVHADELPNMPQWLTAVIADAEPIATVKPRLRGDRVRIDPELRGAMQDGYTSEDVNRILGQISDESGIQLVCVWDYYDGCTGGNSDFYIDPEDGGPLRHLAGDLWRWLNEDPDGPDSPQDLGNPATWIGGVSDHHPDNLAWDDGFHNLAMHDCP